MDSRLMKAGVAMALGMTLLIPTFNAINNSYIEVSEIPPWLPTPTSIPSNFRPPSQLPEKIPENWQPPPDWNPPPEWKDWKPPEDWEGKAQGLPPPNCPPPVIKVVEAATGNFTLRQSDAWTFEAPEYTIGIGVWMNITDWQADEVLAGIDPPGGMDFGDEQIVADDNGGGFPIGGQSQQPPIRWSWIWDPREHNNELPEPGTYTIYLEADPPSGGVPGINNPQLGGDVALMTQIALPCGGAWQ